MFHLHFLRVLSGRDARGACVVKGGCNLRFFFGSARYSEDIDLDVTGTAPGTLRNVVDGVLSSQALARLLAPAAIRVASVTRPKQTDTTQRWRVRLTHESSELPTKIEFSRREAEGDAQLEKLSTEVL